MVFISLFPKWQCLFSRLGRRAAATTGALLLMAAPFSSATALDVVASIRPVYALVVQVMGESDQVQLLVTENAADHHYHLSPSDRVLLSNADLIVRIDPRMETFLSGSIGREIDTPILSLRNSATQMGLLTRNLIAGYQIPHRNGQRSRHDHEYGEPRNSRGDPDDHEYGEHHNTRGDPDDHEYGEHHNSRGDPDDHEYGEPRNSRGDPDDHEYGEPRNSRGDPDDHERGEYLNSRGDPDDHEYGEPRNSRGDHGSLSMKSKKQTYHHEKSEKSEKKEHHKKQRRSSGSNDFHDWLNPQIASVYLDVIASRLSLLNPDQASTYLENARLAKQRIATLDAQIAKKLESVKEKSFLATHDAYSQFARHYQINYLGAIESGHRHYHAHRGARTQIRHRRLLRQLSPSHQACLLSGNDTPPRWAADLVEENALVLTTVDPTGFTSPLDSNLYNTLMQSLTDNLVACLTDLKQNNLKQNNRQTDSPS